MRYCHECAKLMLCSANKCLAKGEETYTKRRIHSPMVRPGMGSRMQNSKGCKGQSSPCDQRDMLANEQEQHANRE